MLHVVSYRALIIFSVALSCIAPELSFADTSAFPPQQHVSTGVQSFREWKSAKVQDAQLRVKFLKQKIKPEASTAMGTQDPNLAMKSVTSEAGLSRELNDQLEREILNLSLTQDLTMSDYFVGYLTKQASLDLAIRDLSTRLTPEEVAELMSAYAQNFFQTKPSTVKVAPRADSGQ
ncbi:hypothetical protein K2P97_00655 [bacterium]|nr:hypothetical protein [bacterium]